MRDQRRGEQVHVHNAAAEAEQVFAVDESQCFVRTGLTGGLQAGEVGLDVLYPGAENPFRWMSETIDLKKKRNFFETRVIEYQRGGALSRD